MNIFYLDEDPAIAAKYHNDKHVRKMIIETAQMLSTIIRLALGVPGIMLDPKHGYIEYAYCLPDERCGLIYIKSPVYYAALPHHPCTKWAGFSRGNFEWLTALGICLGVEYSLRFQGNVHASEEVVKECREYLPYLELPCEVITPPALAMPDDCKRSDAVISYRLLYHRHKRRFCTWTVREEPYWYKLLTDSETIILNHVLQNQRLQVGAV